MPNGSPPVWRIRTRGIGVLLLHPGWVRTRMGGSSVPISPEESVRGMLSLVDHYEPNLSGGFFRFDGTRMPWWPVRYASYKRLALIGRST
jgi:hypothetical protein